MRIHLYTVYLFLLGVFICMSFFFQESSTTILLKATNGHISVMLLLRYIHHLDDYNIDK